MAAEIPAVSKEYLHGPVTSNVALDSQPVAVAFLPTNMAAPNEATTWYTAEWEGTAGPTRTWRILIGPGTLVDLDPAQYNVWVRVTDSTEQPVRKHDRLTIT